MLVRLFGLVVAVVFTIATQAHALILADTDDKIQVITGSPLTTNGLMVKVDWADITSTTLTPGSSDAHITTATTTDIVASPGASTQRQIKRIYLRNTHGSSSSAVTVQFYNGTNAREIFKYTILAGEEVVMDGEGAFRVYTSSGEMRFTFNIRTPNGDSAMDDTNDAVRTSAVTVSPVSGNVAHDSAESQYPVITGCHATASLSGETLVTAGDAARCYAGRDGAVIMRPDASLEDMTYAVVTATTGANTSLVAAAGAGIKTCIKHIIVNGIGTTSSNYAILTDGSGGTTKADLVYPSGTAATYQFPLPLCSTANTAWYVDSQGSETIRVTVGYFKSQE